MAKISTMISLTDNISKVLQKIANRANNATDKMNAIDGSIENITKNANKMSRITTQLSYVNEKIKTQKDLLSNLQNKYDKTVKSMGESSDAALKLKSRILDSTYSIEKMRSKAVELKAALSSVDNVKTSKVKNLFDKISNGKDEVNNLGSAFDSLKSKIGTAVGVAGVTMGVGALFNLGTDSKKAMNQFQGRTGVSKVDMQKYSTDIKALYADNMGESMSDVANSMATVKINMGLDDTSLKAATNNALLLRDTFEFEINESTRSARMVMDQFGLSAEQSYNLIVQGAQNGLNKNDDLLDTINEYSVHFKQLGFNAEDMFNMLMNGAANGTFSVDKLGDSIKEFGIRAIDGSKTTIEGFTAMGLDADKMAQKFKAGGETGKAAFMETVTALKAMEDPIEQNTAGVNLFGTMWEDLGAEGIFALTNLNGEIDVSKDKLSELNNIKYDDASSALASLGRTINVQLADVTSQAVESTRVYIQDFTTILVKATRFATNHKGAIKALMATYAGYKVTMIGINTVMKIKSKIDKAAIIAKKIKTKLTAKETATTAAETAATAAQTTATTAQTAATGAATVAQTALNAAMNLCPVLLLVTGVATLGAGLVSLADKFNPANRQIGENSKKIAESVAGINDFATAIENCQPSLMDYNKLLSANGNLMNDIDQNISETENAITNILQTALQNQQNLRDEDIAHIDAYLEKLRGFNQDKLSIYQGQQGAITSDIEVRAEMGALDTASAAQLSADAKEAATQTIEAAKSAYQDTLAQIENMKPQLNNTDYEGKRKAAYADYVANKIAANNELIASYNAVAEASNIAAQNSLYSELAKLGELKANPANLDLSEVLQIDYNYSAKLATMTTQAQDAANQYLTLASDIKASGGTLSTEMQTQINTILSAFDNVPSKCEEDAKNVIIGMIDGMKFKIPDLADTSEMSAKEITNAVREHLKINSPSKVMYAMGVNVIEGMMNGMESKTSSLMELASSIAEGVKSKIESVLDINSPSRVAFKIGEYFDIGLINGLKSMIGDIERASTLVGAATATTPEKIIEKDYITADDSKLNDIKSGGTYQTNNKNININVEMPVNIDNVGSEKELRQFIKRLEDVLEEAVLNNAEGVY